MREALLASLAQYIDPYLKKDLVTLKAIKALDITAEKVAIEILLNYPVKGTEKKTISALNDLLLPIISPKKLDIQLKSELDAHVARPGITALPNVKNIIAIASGKGGVGKSTVAVNLAAAFAQIGARVGMVDADIYGPSQTVMLGTHGMKPKIENQAFIPIEKHGIYSISIGNLIDAETPMVWRGPMIGKAMQQLFADTNWPVLDYLIVDLPPGTGDIQLTLCQKIPVSGAVMVTTPQDIALLDVKKACEMFVKLEVPILGIVENMSVFQCPHCEKTVNIFGEGGGHKLSQQYHAELLGSVPLSLSIRELGDSGMPIVQSSPESEYANIFVEMARKIGAKLASERKDYSSRFPKIIVKHTQKKESL